eukprot:1372495-Pyramimonas_sp.AAC.1
MMFARGRGSISKIVRNSLGVPRIFIGFVMSSAAKVVRSAIANFRAAGHRFESFAKPLGRSALHLHACIRTALHLAATRTDEFSTHAKTWLKWVNTER